MKGYRKGLVSTLLTLGLLTMAACGRPPAVGGGTGEGAHGGHEAHGQAAAGSAAGAPAGAAGGQRLRIAIGHGLDYVGVDPLGPGRENTLLATIIYEPLLLETADGKLEPALAERWESDPTGTHWTFHLRRGVTFHDGTPFDARAVVRAYERHLRDPEKARRLGEPRVEIVDDYTVSFHLNRPHAPFLSVVGSFSTVIPGPNAYGSDGNLVKPVGTGPFQVTRFTREHVLLARYEKHWRQVPALEEVEVKYIPDPATMILALEAGEVDVIGADGYGVPRNEIRRLEADPRFRVLVNTKDAALEWIGFNLHRPPFDDLRVRQAFNYAVDREAITRQVLEGYAVPARGPIGYDASIPWTNTAIEGYRHHPERARALLEEAGWKDTDGDGIRERDGRPLRATLLFEPTRDWKLVAEALRTQLRQVGMDLRLEMRDGALIRDLQKKGDFEAAAQGSIGKSLVDPYYYLVWYYSSRGRGSLLHDPGLDGLIARSLSTLDPGERERLYHEIQARIMEILPGAYLYHPARVTVVRADVEGWESAGTMDPLRFLWKVSRRGGR
ncbi:ABC transporter substrate-binding protein [Caldinitratiruptor microaerophilus]|uniref:ABC transporter substrate-binding protein n=1 Tax=Caldinitratiruptor microaerophilus TaxID=671077 RepID=A0AA35CL29_9FIRM|nr:ABC transporter substrate-binding protein [Caldinitratiruptor microaerophilus]BDG59291.1 ABC transporter substrate-binding protein [Caldinitratiruptor microaerophilus]